MPFLNSPLRNFQRKTVPELPGGNLQHRAEDAGNRPQDEKEKAGTQRWVPAFSLHRRLPLRGSLLIRLFGAALFLRGGFHDHTADLLGVGFVHDEPPAAALENFSLLGNMPGFKAQVAADGIHLVSLQIDAEFFQILKVGATGQRIARIPERMDILFLGRVVLVFDVAHRSPQGCPR